MNSFHRIAELIAADDKRVLIAPLSQIVRLQTVRAGMHVTIGIPGEFMGPLSRGELSGGLLLVDPAALKEEPAPASMAHGDAVAALKRERDAAMACLATIERRLVEGLGSQPWCNGDSAVGVVREERAKLAAAAAGGRA